MKCGEQFSDTRTRYVGGGDLYHGPPKPVEEPVPCPVTRSNVHLCVRPADKHPRHTCACGLYKTRLEP